MFSVLVIAVPFLTREQKEREKQQKLEQEREEKRRRQLEEEKKRKEEEEKRKKAEKEKADKERAAKKVLSHSFLRAFSLLLLVIAWVIQACSKEQSSRHVGIDVFWGTHFSPNCEARVDMRFEKGQKNFMPKNLNYITVTIILKGIDKIKTEKSDNITV